MGQSYWAKDRSREMIRGAMEHSLCYGVYDEQDYMVGYARVITDHTTTFYLMDVIIDEAYRHQGLGTMLMDQVMEDMEGLHGVLHTTDARHQRSRQLGTARLRHAYLRQPVVRVLFPRLRPLLGQAQSALRSQRVEPYGNLPPHLHAACRLG